MVKTLGIEKNKTNQFVARELKKNLNIFKIGIGITTLIFAVIGITAKVYYLPLILLAVFGPVFLYVSAIFKGDLKALATAFQFTLNEDSISRLVDWGKLNTFHKIRAKRASSKYGTSLEQKIDWTDIDSIKIKETEIKVISNKANPLNQNGIIIIPCELEMFKQVVEYFSSNKSKFKNVEIL